MTNKKDEITPEIVEAIEAKISAESDAPKGRTYSAKDFAAMLNVDAKALRSIMRKMTDVDDQPGSGGRWAIVVPSQRATELAERVKTKHHKKVVQF